MRSVSSPADHLPVYGIPTKVQGKARVCWKAGFRKDERYPVFDLDGVYRSLYFLSTELLKGRW